MTTLDVGRSGGGLLVARRRLASSSERGLVIHPFAASVRTRGVVGRSTEQRIHRWTRQVALGTMIKSTNPETVKVHNPTPTPYTQPATLTTTDLPHEVRVHSLAHASVGFEPHKPTHRARLACPPWPMLWHRPETRNPRPETRNLKPDTERLLPGADPMGSYHWLDASCPTISHSVLSPTPYRLR
jgi:hypothetical protein